MAAIIGKQRIPMPDTSSPKTKSISFLTSHLVKADNHLWQALNSLQSQANAIIGSFASICYGTMQDRINSDPKNLSLGSLWFVTDFPGAIYQIRNNTKDAKQEWFWAGGVIWLPDNVPFNPGYTLGPNDIGLMLARHGNLLVWDGIGPQLQCLIFGPCSASGGGGNTGGGSAGSPGTGGGTVGTTPPVSPIPPGVAVAGPVSNFQVSNTTVDTTNQTVTGTFTWTAPTTNPDLYVGVQLWAGGGVPIQLISPGTVTSPVTVTIPFPSVGAEPMLVTAVTVDAHVGLTQNPYTGEGQNGPTIIWDTGTGGGPSGTVVNLVFLNTATNPDGSVSTTVAWSTSSIIGIAALYFGGVQVWLVASSGSEPQTLLGSVSGTASLAPQYLTITAPASAIGETWTIAAITFNTVGTLANQPSQFGSSAFQSAWRTWVVGS